MGQKTEFNLDDWAFPEEKSLSTETTPELSDNDLITDIDDDFSLLEQSLEPLAGIYEPSTEIKEPSAEIKEPSEQVKFEKNESSAELKTLIEVQGNNFHITGLDNNEKELTQEEEAFRRQIQDLFELLEMEKAADKSDGIRVYQTDSSPSRPWRFH